MINKAKFFSFTAITLMLPLFVSHGAFAQFNPTEKTCEELTASQRAQSAICQEGQNTDDPITGSDGVVTKVVNILSVVAGIIAVIIIVVAGITMTLSAGDPKKVSDSRNAIIYAAVGILVLMLSRSIIIFIINRIG